MVQPPSGPLTGPVKPPPGTSKPRAAKLRWQSLKDKASKERSKSRVTASRKLLQNDNLFNQLHNLGQQQQLSARYPNAFQVDHDQLASNNMPTEFGDSNLSQQYQMQHLANRSPSNMPPPSRSTP